MVVPPCPFDIGDLVIGKDRSYSRSVYKYISETESEILGLFEFQQLKHDVVDRYRDIGVASTMYTFVRRYAEFKLASVEEIDVMRGARYRYCVFRLLGKLGVPDNTNNYLNRNM